MYDFLIKKKMQFYSEVIYVKEYVLISKIDNLSLEITQPLENISLT